MVSFITLIHALRVEISPTVLLYLVAAIVSRFWHKDMWIVYLAMAITAALIQLH
jgi:hypothetical protein